MKSLTHGEGSDWNVAVWLLPARRCCFRPLQDSDTRMSGRSKVSGKLSFFSFMSRIELENEENAKRVGTRAAGESCQRPDRTSLAKCPPGSRCSSLFPRLGLPSCKRADPLETIPAAFALSRVLAWHTPRVAGTWTFFAATSRFCCTPMALRLPPWPQRLQ